MAEDIKDNFFVKTYSIINRMQNEIGSGAEVTIMLQDNELVFRIDWWKEFFHVRYPLKFSDLIKSDDRFIDYLISFCTHRFRNRSNAN